VHCDALHRFNQLGGYALKVQKAKLCQAFCPFDTDATHPTQDDRNK
jgi:hypothetical protein